MTERMQLRPEAAEIFRRLDALGLKQRELANALNLEQNKISKARSGERQFKAPELLAALRWLDSMERESAGPERGAGTDSPVSSDHLPTRPIDDGVVEITSLDLSASMGPGTLVEDFVESEPVKMDINVLRSITRSAFHHLRVIRGDGDSMEPTLRTNDRVLVDTSERTMARMHGIYWIDYAGAHGIKRLRPAGRGRIKIISDNEGVGDTFEVDADEIRIHGRAIMFWREL